MNLIERQEEIIGEFEFFDDWMDKYAHIIYLGNDIEHADESFLTDENLIKGCQSKVWIQSEKKDGKIFLRADSNSSIAKGIVALVLRALNGLPFQEVLDADLYFIKKIGLQDHLSPNRSNGLLAMIKQVKLYAMVYSQQEKLTS